MINAVFTYGFVCSIIMSVLILGSIYSNPRLWIRDLPVNVRSTLPPITVKEKYQSFVLLLLFFGIMISIPMFAVQHVHATSFIEAWLISYSVLLFFNFWDLLILDWLIVCFITPKFMRLEGVDTSHYKNYKKHLYDFFKGILYLSVPSFVSALIGYFF